MAIITPDSQFVLLSSPLSRGYLHTLTFPSKDAQHNYFAGLPSRYSDKDDWSYIRKDGVVRINLVLDDVVKYNYCMYKNTSYGNKWFYAFITDVVYKNEHCTDVYIATDEWQTWQFDIDWKQCYVEREHVSDDTVGKHTVPEPITFSDDYYEYTTITPGAESPQLSGDICYGIASSVTLATGAKDAVRNIVSGCPQACYLYGFTSYTAFNNAINKFYSDATIYGDDPIVFTFTYPSEFSLALHPETDGKLGHTPDPLHIDISFSRSDIVGKVTSKVKNNKCATFPYMMLNTLLPTGTIDWRLESFKSNTIKFTGYLAVSANTTLAFIPNYEDENLKFEISEYPQAPFKSSLTGQWEANMLNLKVGTLLNLGQTAFGGNSIPSTVNYGSPEKVSPSVAYQQPHFDTGGAGVVANSLMSVGGTLMSGASSKINMEMQQQRQTPKAQGYSNTWSTLVSKRNRVIFGYSKLKDEILTVLDDYFTMYGYQVNRVKVPAHNNRPGWNYIKCANANMTGTIPQSALDAINMSLNRGITLWHTTSGFMDYSGNNK